MNKPRTQCRWPGCVALLRGEPYCDAHARLVSWQRPAWQGVPTLKPQRTRSARWFRLRKAVLARDPICRACGERVSQDVDHIQPLAEGGRDVMGNLQGLCRPCHKRKTAQEAARGHERARLARHGHPVPDATRANVGETARKATARGKDP